MEICKIKDNQTTDLETIKMTIWGQQFSNERSHNAHLTVVLTQESQCHDALEDQRRLLNNWQCLLLLTKIYSMEIIAN